MILTYINLHGRFRLQALLNSKFSIETFPIGMPVIGDLYIYMNTVLSVTWN